MKDLKSSELMLNNYILRNGKLFQVDEDTYMDMAYSAREDSFEAIPLTEEWLLKFGFIINRLDYKSVIYKDEELLEIRGNDIFFTADKSIYLTKKIKHVHQLQNLFLALIQEELELK